MPNQRSNVNPIPDSLVVAIESRHIVSVSEWWNGLTDVQRHGLLDDATNQPNAIATQSNLEYSLDNDEPNEWYEYVVNQDMRFYFDRYNACQTSHGDIVYPLLSAISVASDADVVSHVLKRQGN